MCVQVRWTPTYYQGVPTFSPNGSDWLCWGSVKVDSAPRVLSGAVSGYVACIRGEWWFSAVPAHAALVRPSLVISPQENMENPPRSTTERSQQKFTQRLLIPGSKMCVFDWNFVSFSPMQWFWKKWPNMSTRVLKETRVDKWSVDRYVAFPTAAGVGGISSLTCIKGLFWR